MFLSEALDRTVTIFRLSSPPTGTGWGGDQEEVFVALGIVPCRFEVTDLDVFTIWTMAPSIAPRVQDRVQVSGYTELLDIIRVKPWSKADGSFHHYEIVAKAVYPTRVLTDAE